MSQNFERNIFDLASIQRQESTEEALRLEATKQEQTAREAAYALYVQRLRNEVSIAGRQVAQAAKDKNIVPDVIEHQVVGPWYRPKRETIQRGWTIDRDCREIGGQRSLGWDTTEYVSLGRIDRRTILGLDGCIYVSYWCNVEPWNRPNLTYMGVLPDDSSRLTRVGIEPQYYQEIEKGLVRFIIDNGLDSSASS